MYYYVKGGCVDYGVVYVVKYGYYCYGWIYKGIMCDWEFGKKIYFIGYSMGG